MARELSSISIPNPGVSGSSIYPLLTSKGSTVMSFPKSSKSLVGAAQHGDPGANGATESVGLRGPDAGHLEEVLGERGPGRVLGNRSEGDEQDGRPGVGGSRRIAQHLERFGPAP